MGALCDVLCTSKDLGPAEKPCGSKENVSTRMEHSFPTDVNHRTTEASEAPLTSSAWSKHDPTLAKRSERSESSTERCVHHDREFAWQAPWLHMTWSRPPSRHYISGLPHREVLHFQQHYFAEHSQIQCAKMSTTGPIDAASQDLHFASKRWIAEALKRSFLLSFGRLDKAYRRRKGS